jgi:N-acetyl-D-muramate 6-phosphate phosphatase
MDVSAVLWDFDGTIVNTMFKHFIVNKKIYSLIKPDIKKEDWPDALNSLENYIKAEYRSKNWEDLYENHFGFSKKQKDHAGNKWGDFVSQDNTPTKIFSGVSDVLQKIKLPHGICSQNCSKNIKSMLRELEIDDHFKFIVGYDEIKKQKPDPEGFLLCLEKMKIEFSNRVLFYIGDHKEDVIFAKNAENLLRKRGYDVKVLSIVVLYSGADTKLWNIKPDFEVNDPCEITSIIQRSC